jgi:hypothetical protein
MSSPFKHFFWQQRELERTLQGMRPMLDALDSIPESIFECITNLDLLRDRFTLPAEYLASTYRIQEALALHPAIENLELLSGLNSPAIVAFQRQQAQIDELVKNVATQAVDIDATMRRMIDSVVSTEALLELKRVNESWVNVALQPQLAFQDFAKKHLVLAATGSEVARQNRFRLVDSSADLLGSITKGLDLAALMRPTSEDLWIGSTPEVNVYHTLDGELEVLDLEDPAIDAESAVAESRSGMIAELGARLVQLVYNLNVESEREGQPPVFKPTTKALMACAVIPSRVACDSESFAEIADHLFFLLYEGSGSATRLTVRCDEIKLSGLWRLKHLRLGSRHDIDHGTELDAKKKNRQVGEAYMALVGRVVPRGKIEWMTAQVALYRELVEMLEQIWLGEGG